MADSVCFTTVNLKVTNIIINKRIPGKNALTFDQETAEWVGFPWSLLLIQTVNRRQKQMESLSQENIKTGIAFAQLMWC